MPEVDASARALFGGGNMFCGSCGSSAGESRFCPSCGTAVAKSGPRPSTPPVPPPPPVPGATAAARIPQPPASRAEARRQTGKPSYTPPPPGAIEKKKSNAPLRILVGMGLLGMAIFAGMSSCSGGTDPATPGSGNVGVSIDDKAPAEDFSITQSCEEIRANYMDAEAGSQEERWALEAADEACFGQ